MQEGKQTPNLWKVWCLAWAGTLIIVFTWNITYIHTIDVTLFHHIFPLEKTYVHKYFPAPKITILNIGKSLPIKKSCIQITETSCQQHCTGWPDWMLNKFGASTLLERRFWITQNRLWNSETLESFSQAKLCHFPTFQVGQIQCLQQEIEQAVICQPCKQYELGVPADAYYCSECLIIVTYYHIRFLTPASHIPSASKLTCKDFRVNQSSYNDVQARPILRPFFKFHGSLNGLFNTKSGWLIVHEWYFEK